MLRRNLAAAALPFLIIACGGADDTAAQTLPTAAVTDAPLATPATTGALGLTEAQLLDADLIDTKNLEIGDVEAVGRNSEGVIDRLLVEVEDSNPDHFVHIPIAGLKPVQQGNDWDLQIDSTRDNLMALPEAPRR